MTSTWIAIEDREIDGDVEVVRVRNEHGVQGLRVRPREGDLQAFDHFYAEISNHPAIPILERTPGEVVFAQSAAAEDIDVHRIAVDALDALRRQPTLKTLSADAFEVGADGRVRILPRWQPAEPLDPQVAVGRFLQRISAGHEDPRLESTIEALLDASPEIRRTSRSLLQGNAGAPGRTGEVMYTVAAKERITRGALDHADPRATVVITADDLRDLDYAGRSAAAGIAGLPVASLDGLIAAGLPLVLETHGRSQPARIAAARIEKQTGLPVQTATGASVFTLLAASALGTTSIVTGLSAFSLAAVGVFAFVPAIGAAISLALAGFTAWSLYTWGRDRSLLKLSIEAASEAEEERQRHSQNSDLARAWTTLSDARRSLAASDLPSAPASDVRGVLGAAERELVHLSKRSEVIHRGLKNSSSADVQRRLDAVDAADDDQARRALTLTQTLVEVTALENERDHLVDSAHELESVLAEITHSVARWESAPEQEAAINKVLAATARARARARL